MSILKAPASGLQELSWHYNFKIPEKSMGSIWGIAVSIFFLGMSRNLSVIRETLELVGLCKDRCGISDGNAENPGCDLSGGICERICKDAGYQTIAGQIEVFARLSILAIECRY